MKKYPDNIKKALDYKYKSLSLHKQHIKNIMRNSSCMKILWWTIGELTEEDKKWIKRHRYMINKIKKDIDNIKNNFRWKH